MTSDDGAPTEVPLPGAVPEVPVSDLDRATTYYLRHLGFTADWGGEELGLAGISRDGCRLFLANSAYREHFAGTGPVVLWLNLASRDEVDALHREWSARDAQLLSAPESKSWGLHEFTATDLDGNLLRVFHDFATPEGQRPLSARR